MTKFRHRKYKLRGYWLISTELQQEKRAWFGSSFRFYSSLNISKCPNKNIGNFGKRVDSSSRRTWTVKKRKKNHPFNSLTIQEIANKSSVLRTVPFSAGQVGLGRLYSMVADFKFIRDAAADRHTARYSTGYANSGPFWFLIYRFLNFIILSPFTTGPVTRSSNGYRWFRGCSRQPVHQKFRTRERRSFIIILALFRLASEKRKIVRKSHGTVPSMQSCTVYRKGVHGFIFLD